MHHQQNYNEYETHVLKKEGQFVALCFICMSGHWNKHIEFRSYFVWTLRPYKLRNFGKPLR